MTDNGLRAHGDQNSQISAYHLFSKRQLCVVVYLGELEDGSFSRADRGIGGVRHVAPPTWLVSNFLVPQGSHKARQSLAWDWRGEGGAERRGGREDDSGLCPPLQSIVLQRVGHDWSNLARVYSLQKSSKVLLCVHLEVDPGSCPRTAPLFLDCLSLVSASFATI